MFAMQVQNLLCPVLCRSSTHSRLAVTAAGGSLKRLCWAARSAVTAQMESWRVQQSTSSSSGQPGHMLHMDFVALILGRE